MAYFASKVRDHESILQRDRRRYFKEPTFISSRLDLALHQLKVDSGDGKEVGDALKGICVKQNKYKEDVETGCGDQVKKRAVHLIRILEPWEGVLQVAKMEISYVELIVNSHALRTARTESKRYL